MRGATAGCQWGVSGGGCEVFVDADWAVHASLFFRLVSARHACKPVIQQVGCRNIGGSAAEVTRWIAGGAASATMAAWRGIERPRRAGT